MQWEILIIPLIAVGVWILGTLFKGGEEDRTKKGARKAGATLGRGSARRPVTDLDRFLEDARRRRETEEKRKAPAAPPPRDAKPVPLSERPSRLLERPSRPVPTARRAEEVPVAIPVVRPVPQPATIREAAVEAAPIVPRSKPSAEPPLVAPAITPDKQPSTIVQQVRSLLSKPQSAGTAFVLREIFDRPRFLRRR